MKLSFCLLPITTNAKKLNPQPVTYWLIQYCLITFSSLQNMELHTHTGPCKDKCLKINLFCLCWIIVSTLNWKWAHVHRAVMIYFPLLLSCLGWSFNSSAVRSHGLFSIYRFFQNTPPASVPVSLVFAMCPLNHTSPQSCFYVLLNFFFLALYRLGIVP